ncbi:replication endonuclease [Acetobacter thailandicus]|uniref:hypothetical protein n=1 Tax=Acetobacter thailandicus TaxID=1502842 RepID=UPI001BA7FB81|nr:hypothetical protein [Acetobacter thailandicus]MBS0980823.1 hypothetical protein [Acetobacter thailandicus]
MISKTHKNKTHKKKRTKQKQSYQSNFSKDFIRLSNNRKFALLYRNQEISEAIYRYADIIEFAHKAITLTIPPAFHRNSKKAKAEINRCWKNFLTEIHRKNIQWMGTKVEQPHNSDIPHLHLSAHMSKKDEKLFKEILLKHFPADKNHTKEAYQDIYNSNGWTGYLIKVIKTNDYGRISTSKVRFYGLKKRTLNKIKTIKLIPHCYTVSNKWKIYKKLSDKNDILKLMVKIKCFNISVKKEKFKTSYKIKLNVNIVSKKRIIPSIRIYKIRGPPFTKVIYLNVSTMSIILTKRKKPMNKIYSKIERSQKKRNVITKVRGPP